MGILSQVSLFLHKMAKLYKVLTVGTSHPGTFMFSFVGLICSWKNLCDHVCKSSKSAANAQLPDIAPRLIITQTQKTTAK